MPVALVDLRVVDLRRVLGEHGTAGEDGEQDEVGGA
jgi:hypothetical protein